MTPWGEEAIDRPRFALLLRLPRLRIGGPWLIAAALALVAGLVAFGGTGYRYRDVARDAPLPALEVAAADDKALGKLARDLRNQNKKLTAAVQRNAPRATYVVIDRTHNRVYLRRGDQVLLEGLCSAGSGMVLNDEKGGRSWVFDSPQGQFKVLNKLENPVWKKPDWAFLEMGEPIPKNPADRFEYGVLGEYALYFGNGFMLHGTLYERLLGRSVSHGCIRIGRDDLRRIWKECPVGTPIYIF